MGHDGKRKPRIFSNTYGRFLDCCAYFIILLLLFIVNYFIALLGIIFIMKKFYKQHFYKLFLPNQKWTFYKCPILIFKKESLK